MKLLGPSLTQRLCPESLSVCVEARIKPDLLLRKMTGQVNIDRRAASRTLVPERTLILADRW